MSSAYHRPVDVDLMKSRAEMRLQKPIVLPAKMSNEWYRLRKANTLGSTPSVILSVSVSVTISVGNQSLYSELFINLNLNLFGAKTIVKK